MALAHSLQCLPMSSCLDPVNAWIIGRKPNGKNNITFSRDVALQHPSQLLTLPCGRCLACTERQSVQWAVRCVHEAAMFTDNYFVTLTYAPEHLLSPSIDESDFVNFMKLLRKPRNFGPGVRFFHRSEYGSRYGRPHHHVLLFNCPLRDLTYYRTSESGYQLYRSAAIEKIWYRGFVTVGIVDYDCAFYAAAYLNQAIVRGDRPGGLAPEKISMSRRPGLGANYLHQYWRDMYNNGSCLLYRKKYGKTLRYTMPRYYNNYIQSAHPVEYKLLTERRRKYAIERNELQVDRYNVGSSLRSKLEYKYKRRSYDNE